MSAVLTVVIAGLALAMPATAAPGDPLYLWVTKSVSNETPAPGEPFTYTVRVSCSEQSCLDARLTDQFPAELAGFDLLSVDFNPSDAVVPRTITWNVDGATSATAPAVVTADTGFTVDFTGAVTAPSGTGLQYGRTFTALLTLQAPSDLGPGVHVATNTARTEATNSAPDADSATVTVTVAQQLGVQAYKNWTPGSSAFQAGASSVISLRGTNASNIDVGTLSIQEPTTAPDGASALDASNPFTIADFVGLSGLSAPQGATTVQLDAYVESGGVWSWVGGTPVAVGTSPTLPSGVTAADVGGVRLTYAGDAVRHDGQMAFTVDLAQRATHRDTGVDLSLASHTVVNSATATVTAPGLPPASAAATANHTITPPSVDVSATKNFNPDRIAAGDVTTARLTATNESDVGVRSLSMSDQGFFRPGIEFDGFGSTFTWPQGATDAVVTYALRAGGTETENLVAPAAPAGPSGVIDGFDIVFSAATGTIPSGASAVVDADIDTAESVTASTPTVRVDNTLDVAVEATNGVTDTASATDRLTLLRPAITATMTKSVLPSGPVNPGDRVVVALQSRTLATSDYVTVNRIVVEDAFAGTATFWDAFTLDSVAGTQVPADATLAIEARDGSGGWHAVGTFGPQAAPFLAALSAGDIDTALAGAGLDHTDVVGLRFTFTATRFAQDTTVTPYIVAYARDTLRSGQPVASGTDATVSTPNTATVTGGGDTPEGTPVTGTGGGTTTGSVSDPGVDPAVELTKTWNLASVTAQADQAARTRLDWSVNEGYTTVEITDAASVGNVEGSAYDAFDLTGISPVSASATPFSSGWFLRYDTVTAVELYDGTNWTAVPAPTGGWSQSDGRFPGYTLTAGERATTVGVRLRLVENTPARVAATTLGASYDPYAPAPGSGVGASSGARTFELRWQLRDTTRVAGDWVTPSRVYNTTDAGVVNNVATADARVGTVTETATAQDTILITSAGLGVRISKSVNPATPMYVPDPGVDPNTFPTARFTIEARNDSVVPASYVRIMDSPACDDLASITACESVGTAAGALADPFDTGVEWLTRPGGNNPFDRFDLTNVDVIASRPAEVDLNASVVWLLTYSGGVYSTQQTTAAAVNAMTAAQLANVVGVSATLQGSDPSTTGGTITSSNRLTLVLDVRARTHLRSSGAVQDIVANATVSVPNSAFAQTYNPVLNDGQVDGARATATAVLTGGDINVGAVKNITPAALTEPTRHDPVSVTLGGNQGAAPASTLAPAEVRLTDSIETAPEFWDRFDFVGLDSITAPAGADRVAVSVYGPFGPGGALAWVDGGPQELTAAAIPVPSGQYGDIEGVRFVFSRADGAFFSNAVPAPAWSTSVHFTVALRDTHRADGDPVELTGTIPNTVEVIADRLNGESSVVRTAADTIGLSLGTFRLEVGKVANNGVHAASAGEQVPWDLTFTNSGTGYLTINELRDVLPSHLVYLGATAPVYTPDPSGMLPAPDSVGFDGGDLVFTWPAGGRTMAPGETFSVRLMLELQPGLSAAQRTTNTMVVTTAQTLDSCGPVQSGGAVTGDWASDPTTCGASDYVTPTVGPNLFTVKGVRGAVDGAYNPVTPSSECLQSLSATGGDYYRAPCAANSVIGGVDSWVLRVQNAGTTGVSSVDIFDALPAPGDAFLISGGARGSDFRPHMLDDLAVALPVGATYTVSTTSTPGACEGTWANLQNQEPCAQNGETWAPAGPGTAWDDVTAVRVIVNFAGTASGALQPGEFVDVTYSTLNVPASASNPDGAAVSVPASDDFAWNQFGVKYQDQGASDYRKISPAHVGVHLVTGAIEVHKEFTGSGAALAPGTIVANVACTIEGVPISMGAFGEISLRSADGYVQRIDGIPVGSDCLVSEKGAVGAFFEVSRPADNIDVVVSQAIATTAPVPADQIATLINEYRPVLAFTGVQGLDRLLGWMTALLVLGVGLVVWADKRRAAGS